MREVYGFERPQALVEIDQAVGIDGAGNCVGPLLVAVELVIVMGRSMRSARQLGPLQSMGLIRSLSTYVRCDSHQRCT